MKTIKQLEAEKEAMDSSTGKPISVIDLGRLEALKDVLKLINKLDPHKQVSTIQLLKSKIQGGS